MKKITKIIACLVGGVLLFFGGYHVGKAIGNALFNNETIIGKPEVTVIDGRMTPEILWSFGRIGEYAVSPDGQTIAYTVTYFCIEQNRGNAEIFLMNADGSNVRQLTRTAASERNLVWSIDGQRIYHLYQGQIHEITVRNGRTRKLSDFSRGIEGFSLSPDQSQVLYVMTVDRPQLQSHLFTNLPKSRGHVIEDLHYRHWDEWVKRDPQLFLTDFGRNMTDGINLLYGTPYQAPMRPFGGMGETAWSPCGTKIAYNSKKIAGIEWAISTNADIFIFDIATRTTRNISEGMMGYDRNPRFSPCGTMIAWETQEREGYQSDQRNLATYNFRTGARLIHTTNYDFDVQNLLWSRDSETIYFLVPWHGRTNIRKIDLATNTVTPITNEDKGFGALRWLGDKLIATGETFFSPNEIFSIGLNGNVTQLSQVNTDLLAQLDMGTMEERWISVEPTIPGGPREEMLTWVFFPPDFNPNNQYPAILFCGGGPQSMVGHHFSYRWNFPLMTAHDYIIVAPNRRGVPGFGQAWNEQISGDWGGMNKRDLLRAIDVVAEEPFVDENRLGAAGASYGGFSTFWLAGHNCNNRFQALLAHNGIFNFEQFYLEVEIMWFINWEMGGPFWDKNNAIAQRSYASSPHRFVQNWHTPIFVIHCELDYRVPISQGMAAFNAAQLMGVPSRFLYFPDENHWILTAQNGILWQRSFIDWFDEWLK
ncbi:MAG: S9 family peptidase [Bacteroidales bacterium]|nr:S9 family peptidase [Bacteroidales bacterium]